MDYLEFAFRITPAEPGMEIAQAALSTLPFDSFTMEDDVLRAYIPEDQFVQADFDDLFLWDLDGFEIDYQISKIEQKNWNEEWEKNFSPIDVDGRATIRAPFHLAPASGMDILIEPRMSFGTGHHQTTYMMVTHVLDTDCAGKDVCDMGCGTGVLAIAAAKKGAKHILAADIDEWAYGNAMDNVAANSCPQIRVVQGGAEVLGSETFDLFLANINRNILVRYMADYARAVRPGGHLVMSGFYVPDNEAITAEAAKYGFTLEKALEKDRWSSLKFRKEG